MRIRQARAADFTAVEVLLRSTAGVWQPTWRSDAVQRALLSSDGLAYVAENDGVLIGFVCAHDTGFRAYLSELVVTESHHRCGVGSALMAAVHKGVAQRGCKLVVADIYPPAVPFYRRLGWREPQAALLCRDVGSDDAV